jgi:RND family efflux transporter MFP subunit
MKRPARNIVIICIAAIILAGAYWVYRQRQGIPESSEERMESPGQVAKIRVVSVKKGTLTSVVVLYGNIIPAPGAIQTISVQYECRVHHIMVSDAQKISSGDPLIEVGPSPDTFLKVNQARNEFRTSKQTLSHTQDLFDLKLATNNQLLQAKETFEQARLALESLEKRSAAENEILKAGLNGLVVKVHVQEGAIVAPGSPLLDIVAKDRLEARLQVEAENLPRLQTAQQVLLSHVNAPVTKEVEGKIRRISSAVNPDSHFIDVFVTLPDSADFLLGEYVYGRISVLSSSGIVVPRNAILPEEGGYFLFTVREGHAVKHKVKIGVESENEVRVMGDDLKEGENVVVLGNYELKEGMAIKTDASK